VRLLVLCYGMSRPLHCVSTDETAPCAFGAVAPALSDRWRLITVRGRACLDVSKLTLSPSLFPTLPSPRLYFLTAPQVPGQPRLRAMQDQPVDHEASEYVQFFRKLGILDAQKGIFLASLLRGFREAALRLDTHLAPLGASVHAAVSRMYAADNPNDLPQHRWIRVVDRSGFFTDTDEHARRVINIGLSFAYRHMELDALAADHAVLLREYRLKGTAAAAERAESQGATDFVPSGGVVVAARAGTSAPPESAGDGGVEAGAGPGAPRVATSALAPVSVGAHASGGVTAAGEAPATNEDGGLVPEGGVVVRRRTKDDNNVGEVSLGGPPKIGTAGDSGDAQDRQTLITSSTGGNANDTHNVEHNDDDIHTAVRVSRSVVLKTQPTVKPTASAVTAVCSVLEALKDLEDIRIHLRDLMDKSLLCLARAAPGTAAQPSVGVFSATADGTWTGVTRMLSRWWPLWKEVPGAPTTIPPEGTLTFKRNPGRKARSSPWMILVDMTAINPTMMRLAADSSRYFPKCELPQVELVKRVASGLRQPLTEIVASLLLLATEEEGYGPILVDLASSGRAAARRNVPLLAAACHSFVSSGLDGAAAASLSPSTAARPGLPPPASAGAGGADVGETAAGSSSDELEDSYVKMDVLLQEEREAQTTAERHRRTARRRLARATPAGSVARPRTAAAVRARPMAPCDLGPVKQVGGAGGGPDARTRGGPSAVPPNVGGPPASCLPPAAPLQPPVPTPRLSHPLATTVHPPASSSLPPLPPSGSQLQSLGSQLPQLGSQLPAPAGPSSLASMPLSLPSLPFLWPSLQSQPVTPPPKSPPAVDAAREGLSSVPSGAPPVGVAPSTSGDESVAAPASPDEPMTSKRFRSTAGYGAGT